MLGLGAILGTALNVGQGLLGIGGGNKQLEMADKINPVWQAYKTNNYANKRLGLANQFLNGRMAGATNIENNIIANGQNTLANVGRNATSGSQALALTGMVQGQTNDAYNNLAVEEARNKYSLLGNLNEAYNAMVNEGDKEYQSMLDKYRDDVAAKTNLTQAGQSNRLMGMDKLASTAFNAQSMFGGGARRNAGAGGMLTGRLLGGML